MLKLDRSHWIEKKDDVVTHDLQVNPNALTVPSALNSVNLWTHTSKTCSQEEVSMSSLPLGLSDLIAHARHSNKTQSCAFLKDTRVRTLPHWENKAVFPNHSKSSTACFILSSILERWIGMHVWPKERRRNTKWYLLAKFVFSFLSQGFSCETEKWL